MKDVQQYNFAGRDFKVRTSHLFAAGFILIALFSYSLGKDSGYKDGYAGAYSQCYTNAHPENRPSILAICGLIICGGAALGMALHGMPFTNQTSISGDNVKVADNDFIPYSRRIRPPMPQPQEPLKWEELKPGDDLFVEKSTMGQRFDDEDETSKALANGLKAPRRKRNGKG